MNEAKIYIKGNAGFKSAVEVKLGGTWIHGSSDIGTDIIMFLLSENDDLAAFKESIGEEIITKYHLQFLTDLPEFNDKESSSRPGVGRSLPMSVWTSGKSKTGARENQDTQHDPVVRVF